MTDLQPPPAGPQHWKIAALMQPCDLDNDHESPLTPRTRFMLWLELGTLALNLEDESERGFGQYDDDHPREMFIDQFPVAARDQPADWWEKMIKAVYRMTEGMRTGRSTTPLCIAEEVAIQIVLNGMRENSAAPNAGTLQIIDDEEALRCAFDALPDLGPDRDFRWNEFAVARWNPVGDWFQPLGSA